MKRDDYSLRLSQDLKAESRSNSMVREYSTTSSLVTLVSIFSLANCRYFFSFSSVESSIFAFIRMWFRRFIRSMGRVVDRLAVGIFSLSVVIGF